MMLLFSDNLQQLRAALWQGDPEGRTALYDAIEMSLHQLDFGRQAKKDAGGDQRRGRQSQHSYAAGSDEGRAVVAGYHLYGWHLRRRRSRKERRRAEKLAHVSGGVFYHPQDLEEIVPICRQIAKDIRTRYTIGYVPAVEGKTVRHIKVAASSPDHPKLLVRNRTSYVFPEKATEAQ